MMEHLLQNMTEHIGRTPLLIYPCDSENSATVLIKIEGRNPGGSIKDRAALFMVDRAEREGLLQPGGIIIEPTSGNTGIGLAWIGKARGYKVILTMPETMTEERKTLLRAYGAEVILTPGRLGMTGAIEKAEELLAQTPGAWMARQFENPANAEAHRKTTGPEIWHDTGERIDALVAGVGSGGTLTGTGSFLRQKNPDLHIVAVEPADSPVLSGGEAGSHPIAGIGAGFVPKLLDIHLYNEVFQVTGDCARIAARSLRDKLGLLCGISSGAALSAALEVAQRPGMRGKVIVAILPDSGERYLSTPLFQD